MTQKLLSKVGYQEPRLASKFSGDESEYIQHQEQKQVYAQKKWVPFTSLIILSIYEHDLARIGRVKYCTFPTLFPF